MWNRRLAIIICFVAASACSQNEPAPLFAGADASMDARHDAAEATADLTADADDAATSPDIADEPDAPDVLLCFECPAAVDDVPDVCGDDWRAEPCVGETDDTCKVDELQVGELARTYVVSRTGGYDCSNGLLPVVIWYHGSGGNGASDRNQINETWADLAFEEAVGGAAVFVYPDGLPHVDCLCRGCWDRTVAGKDIAFFDALVARLAQDYCIDPQRIFVAGHSRGGRFVEVLACERSAAITGAASIAAGPDNVIACDGQVPIWLTHGRDDTTIPFRAGEDHRDAWSTRNGCAPSETNYPLDGCTPVDGCPAELPVIWCPTTETDWNGHAVPGLADDALWRFFETLN